LLSAICYLLSARSIHPLKAFKMFSKMKVTSCSRT